MYTLYNKVITRRVTYISKAATYKLDIRHNKVMKQIRRYKGP